MNFPLSTAGSHSSGFRRATAAQPFHERSTNRWDQLPTTAKEVMRRTLGSRPPAALPANPAEQFSRHQPDRQVVNIESASEDMPTQPAALSESHSPISDFPTPLGFVALLAAYRPTGGTVRSDDLSRHVQSQEPGHLTNLARKLVSGAILSFSWRQTLWVPLFQFDSGTSQVKPAVSRVMNELAGAFDLWEISVWFVQPNSWLNGQRPLDLLNRFESEVLHAAKADRLVATG